ncbi:hypothetical protein AB9L13_03065 [Desulfovibrio piger]
MIPVQKVLVRYTVTTGVLEYSVPFALYGTGDVNVSWVAAGDTETQTRLAPGSDYSVTVFRDMTGGKVTLADGKVPAGATLAIESAVPLTQELDLSNTATVDTEATEGQLDRMVQMIQQLDDGLSRAVKVNATDSGTPEELLGSLYKARDAAKDAATAAAASEQAAEGSEQAAATSASQAAASAQAAAASAGGADRKPGGGSRQCRCRLPKRHGSPSERGGRGRERGQGRPERRVHPRATGGGGHARSRLARQRRL